MSLTCILEIYLRFKGRKWCKLNHFRFWKIKKGLNGEIANQDSWTMRKGKTRISWVYKMRNDHYGITKKVRRHGKWGMEQDSTAWKFKTQNLVATYTMILRTKCFSESILDIIFFFLSLGVRSPMLQTICKSDLKWRSYGHLKTTA